MTHRRGYKEKPSKSEEKRYGYLSPYISVNKEKNGVVNYPWLNIRKEPDGEVLDIVKKNTKLLIKEELDSKWVRVTTPSGVDGVAVKEFINIE